VFGPGGRAAVEHAVRDNSLSRQFPQRTYVLNIESTLNSSVTRVRRASCRIHYLGPPIDPEIWLNSLKDLTPHSIACCGCCLASARSESCLYV
jgi:hypothetical protein